MTAGEAAGLWGAVIGLGVYHGLNPAMGWPLAVANGLGERRGRAVFDTGLPLGLGHLLAMAVVLVPFAWLSWYVAWSRPLRLAAGLLVVAFGLYRLIDRRHPRFLQRVPPSRLTWWSFLTATAHGAGLMLVPITLGLCAPGEDRWMTAMMGTSSANLATALAVALLHSAAMIGSGLTIAWIVYRRLGLGFLKRSWFDLDAFWAASLVVTGAASCIVAATGSH